MPPSTSAEDFGRLSERDVRRDVRVGHDMSGVPAYLLMLISESRRGRSRGRAHS